MEWNMSVCNFLDYQKCRSRKLSRNGRNYTPVSMMEYSRRKQFYSAPFWKKNCKNKQNILSLLSRILSKLFEILFIKGVKEICDVWRLTEVFGPKEWGNERNLEKTTCWKFPNFYSSPDNIRMIELEKECYRANMEVRNTNRNPN